MTAAESKRAFFAVLTEAGKSYDILGYTIWWNIRNADVTQEQFAKMLRDSGLDEKYAREHNYRSAFIRALRLMEEKRIIRKVEESPNFLVYQFTAEEKEGSGQNASLEYNQETIVVLSKSIYAKEKDFLAALVKGREDIRKKVADYFEREKVRYGSSDVTRYIQKIFRDQADLLNLRPQGCIYFVPASFQNIVTSVQSLIAALGGGSSLEQMPVPNVGSSRSLVSASFSEEAVALYKQLAAEIKVGLESGDLSDKSKEGRFSSLQELLNRIQLYSPILPEESTSDLIRKIDSLGKSLFPERTLDLE